MATKTVNLFLHDCDEHVLSKDSDATFALGKAQFSLRDFLRPNVRELKLRSDVFPMKKVVPDNTLQLDLNSTARKNDKVIDKFSPYMSNMTYFVIKAELAHPIGAPDDKAKMRVTAHTMAGTTAEELSSIR